MTVLTTILNGSSHKDIRDTWNKALGDIRTLQASGTPTPSPTPTPTVYFDAATISVAEGDSGTRTMTMTARRSSTAGVVTAVANFVQGSAIASDFGGNALPGAKSFVFADGATTATATVVVSGDTDVESDETFGYSLVAPSGYALGSPATLTGTILNDDSATAPGAFTMSQIPQSRGFQRATFTGGTAGKGDGPVWVPVNVTTAGPVYARVRDTSGTVVQGAWLAVANAPAANTELKIPGVHAQAGMIFVDLASSASGPWQQGTTPIGMGDGFVLTGQSLITRLVRNYQGTQSIAAAGGRISPNSRVRCAVTGDGNLPETSAAWEAPSDGGSYSSAGVADLLYVEEQVRGVPCFAVGHSRGATAIADWVPGGSCNADLRANLDKARGFRVLVCGLGHTDSGSGTSLAVFSAGLTAWTDDMKSRSQVLAAGDIETRLFTIPRIIGDTGWGTPNQRAAIRKAGHDWCIATGAASVLFTDQDAVDLTGHQSQVGAIDTVRAIYRAGRPKLGLAHSNAGATLGKPTRAAGSAEVRIPYTLAPGATTQTLVGPSDHEKLFFVFPSGSTADADRLAYAGSSPFTMTSTDFRLTLAAVPAGALDIYFAWPNASTLAMIYDDALDSADGYTKGRHPVINTVPLVCDAPTAPSNMTSHGNVASVPFRDVGKQAMAEEFDVVTGDNGYFICGIRGKDANNFPWLGLLAGSNQWSIGKVVGGSLTVDVTNGFQNDPGPRPWRVVVESVGTDPATMTQSIKINGVTVFDVPANVADAFWPAGIRGTGLILYDFNGGPLRNASTGTR